MNYHYYNPTTGAEDTRILVSSAPPQLYRVVDGMNNKPNQDGHFVSRHAAQRPDAPPIVAEDVANHIRNHVEIWG